MKVYCKHAGCSPALNKHYYHILTETGHADYIWEEQYFPSGEYDMPDELWSDKSGWVDLVCDKCGYEYRERVYIGMVVVCPICGEPELIPENAILEESNLYDDT